ncbi:unnamed protein product [Brassicogethes aeneus]|uniref:Lipase domain-containing protein n=1 Tax=Brassicogethes aeneus TaxID=1431903 RepID=A0A9P0FKZ4_BRAAE|nr:unnamed protein product [Brassicogethes aeneus]
MKRFSLCFLFSAILFVGSVENTSITYVTSYLPKGVIMTTSDIHKESINVLKPLIFIFNEKNTHNLSGIINEYLKKQITNVFIVEYTLNEETTKAANKVVNEVAEFIATIFNKTGEEYLNIHLVGIASGSRVAFAVAQRLPELTKRKVNRLTSLEPTYSLINNEKGGPNAEILSKNVNFVDTVHSNFNENETRLGDVNFYLYKKDCVHDKSLSKNSTLSLETFVKSINSNNLKALECDSIENLENGNCLSKKKIVFGENVPQDAKGSYFLIIKL